MPEFKKGTAFLPSTFSGKVTNSANTENSRYDKEPGMNTHNESDKVTETFDGNRIPLNLDSRNT